MKAEIDIDMETARIAAALAEIKREGAQRKACYPRFVAAGKLDAAESRRRLTALADACRIVQAVLADVEELPFLADGEQPAVAVAAAMAPKPLPYDQGESVKDAPPVCRLCLHPGESDGGEGLAMGWRCTRVGCLAHECWTTLKLFTGGVA